MSDYVKGEKPRDLDAAKGGPTLERVRSFQKSQDVGMLGPPNEQDYDDKGSPAKRMGDKSLPMSTLKKANNRAV
jgi:hypothetical protein